jgi:tetratricopeptide (TPR) repeat protein
MNRILGIFFTICLIFVMTVGLASAQTEQMTPDKKADASKKINLNKVKLLMSQANQAMLKGDEARADELLAEVVDIAHQSWDLGDASTSESIFRQVLNLKSDNADALLGLAELYRRTNPIWAVEYYTRYKAINPSDPAVYYGRGSCYLARDAFALAIEDLKYLVERLEPNHIGGLTNLALAYRGRAVEKNYDPDLFEQAVNYMKQAVLAAENSSDPENQRLLPELNYRLGRLSFEHQQILARAQVGQSNFDPAIESLEESIQQATQMAKKDVDDMELLNQIIFSYDALAEVYNAQALLNPKDANPYIELSRITDSRSAIQVRQSQVTSLNFLKKAVEVEPDVAANWKTLADRYAKLGDVENAIKALDKAIELSPDNTAYKADRTHLKASTQPVTQPDSKNQSE